MKNLTLSISFLFTISLVFAQDCPQGDVVIYFQSDLEEYIQQYPNCTEINGNLIISDRCDYFGLYEETEDCIVDISPLSKIERINGDFRIQVFDIRDTFSMKQPDLPNLEFVQGEIMSTNVDTIRFLDKLEHISSLRLSFFSYMLPLDSLISDTISRLSISRFLGDTLSNFENIKSVTEFLRINTSKIKNLSGLEGIELNGSIEISGNLSLNTLEPLQIPQVLEGSFHIINNDSLDALFGLESIETIGGDLLIERNASLSSLSGLDFLGSVGGDFDIIGNANLEDISQLIQLETFTSLNIENNASLKAISGFDNLTHLNGDININSNGALESLSSFQNLAEMENLTITSNPNLVTLGGFDQLNIIKGDLRIVDNARLTFLQNASNLSQIEGHLIITSNPMLQNLSGLEGLTKLGTLQIKFNETLQSIAQLENVTNNMYLINIGSNPSLASLEGLHNLTEAGAIVLRDNDGLTDLNGFRNLEIIEDLLHIQNCESLESLVGLEKLNNVEEINLALNPSLLDLNALNALNIETLKALKINQNISLACCANSMICAFLEENEDSADIGLNAQGCFDTDQVVEACTAVAEDPDSQDYCDVINSISAQNKRLLITASPNPTSDIIQLNVNSTKDFSFQLYTLNGELVQKSNNLIGNVDLDLSELPKGVYILSLEHDGGVHTEKLVRM